MLSMLDIKAYLKEHGTTGENDLAAHFKTTAPMIAMMCEKLAEKGQVKLIEIESSCGCTCGCNGKTKRAWRLV